MKNGLFFLTVYIKIKDVFTLFLLVLMLVYFCEDKDESVSTTRRQKNNRHKYLNYPEIKLY